MLKRRSGLGFSIAAILLNLFAASAGAQHPVAQRSNIAGALPDSPATLAPAPAAAAPVIAAVTNAADFSFSIAPGSLATIFGQNLAVSAASAPSLPLQTNLNGVTLSISGVAAPLYYVSPGQINFQIPSGTAAGTATAVVTTSGTMSAAYRFFVTASGAGIFQYGVNQGVVQNQNFTLNTANNPAVAGSTIIVYLTGIGATNPPVADGTAAPISPLARCVASYSAMIGDQPASVQFLGLTPGAVGLAQANILVPPLPSGSYPLTVSLDGHQSTSVIIYVSGTSGGFQVSSILTPVSSIALPNGVGIRAADGSIGLLVGEIARFGTTLFICTPGSVFTADISNPLSPVLLKEFGQNDLNGLGRGCLVNSKVSKPFLLVKSGSGRSTFSDMYDLSNPTSPFHLSGFQNFIGGSFLAIFDGNIGFLLQYFVTYDSSSLDIVQTDGNIGADDFTNPASVTAVASVGYDPSQPETNPSYVRLGSLVPQPGLLYVTSTTISGIPTTGTGTLDVFDVSDPRNMRGLSRTLIAGSTIAGSLTMTGNQMLATGNTRFLSSTGILLPSGIVDFPITGNLTLTVFDISNPRSPVLQGNVIVDNLRPNGTCGAISLGRSFYALSCAAPNLLGTGPGINNSLVIVDARDAKNPKAYTYGVVQGLGGLELSNGYLYAATTTGVTIYRVQLP